MIDSGDSTKLAGESCANRTLSYSVCVKMFLVFFLQKRFYKKSYDIRSRNGLLSAKIAAAFLSQTCDT